ncbi:enoyl-CoA hydratase/isomerase family protein [Arthrobacter sp. FW305-BF8]|uniref:enoyl-CoA hydratase-related protein n=1 Tax=Arthrobacter sp. FW305-BF8 TaxID=2879617 RepID=UPI001F0204F8|nr:enoyl-CoA hydratase-related protein [Arthrobacter sp. FW305-BF8]UKA55186.1 enoyl-CoA hydratase/isomerase family protein [Arthrobacter sp. FW305-BF8]
MTNAQTEDVVEDLTSDSLIVSWAAPGVAQLTINRPERRNALNIEVKELVARAVEELGANASVRVIVITGASGAFVAGTDVAEMEHLTPVEHTLRVTDRMFSTLRACPKPLIAAVEGFALGGGCELALCCDIIIASERARFGQPEILLGVIPGAGGTQRLLRAVGRYQAMRLLLTGKHVFAEEAHAMGLVSEVAPEGKALEQAAEMASLIATMPALAVSAIKEVVRAGADVPLDTALLLERKAFQILFDSQDQKEGMRAFLEKRPPEYHGR